MASNRRTSEESIRSLDSSALDSSTALILVHDDDDDYLSSNPPIEDDDDDEPQTEATRRPAVPPLSTSVVFLYLLSPSLKLGAILLPDIGPPRKYTVSSVFIFALATAFVQHLWYMLSRHLRKHTVEDIIPEVFARARRKERRRAFLRRVSKLCVWFARLLLGIVYFGQAITIICPLVPRVLSLSPQLVLAILFGVPLLPLSTAHSFASLRIILISSLSIVTYIAWFISVAIAQARGTLAAGRHNTGGLWRSIPIVAFTYSSPVTPHLYSALKGNQPSTVSAKTPKYRSFNTLSLLSLAVATGFILPSAFFWAEPKFFEPPGRPAPDMQNTIAVLEAITLLLAIPPLIISVPPLPVPGRVRHLTGASLSKITLLVLIVMSAILPWDALRVINDVTLVLSLCSTYILPALLHIVVHNFKRPLSIIVPTHPSTPITAHTPSHSHPEPTTPVSASDELLQRKERLLQKRQFRKRLVWDIGAWVLLIPIGGVGIFWMVGHLSKKW